jgi:hypothetical protein
MTVVVPPASELVMHPELNDAGLVSIRERADAAEVRHAAALIRKREVRVIQKIQRPTRT